MSITKLRAPHAEQFQPVVDPAGWSRADLADTTSWLFELNAAEVADLDRAVARCEEEMLPLIDFRRDRFELPVLGPSLDRIRHQVIWGSGIVLIRGVPVHRYSRWQSAAAFLGLGSYLGVAVSQNGKGHILGHVQDLGDRSFERPTDRRYQTHDKLPFHSDSCDVVGLLCLHHAKTGGASTVVSTVEIYMRCSSANRN